MVDKSALSGAERWGEALEAALDEACSALAAGEHRAAEQHAKAISALARAARDAAEFVEFARAQPPEEDEEALRAELRCRIARFVDAQRAGAALETLERIGAGGTGR